MAPKLLPRSSPLIQDTTDAGKGRKRGIRPTLRRREGKCSRDTTDAGAGYDQPDRGIRPMPLRDTTDANGLQ